MGCAKSDRKIFEKALELADCNADESVMVGDRLDNDMAPAKAIGMKIVWIKNDFAKYRDEGLGKAVIDYQIKSADELLFIL